MKNFERLLQSVGDLTLYQQGIILRTLLRSMGAESFGGAIDSPEFEDELAELGERLFNIDRE